MVKNQIPYNRILYSLLSLLILSWVIVFVFAYDPNQGWHPASQIEGVQVKIGPNCGTDNYVYGVKSDGSLYCRPDLQGSGGIACADCDSRFINVGESIPGDSIEDGTIDSSEIQDNTLTASDLAANSVGNSELTDNPAVTTLILPGGIKLYTVSGTTPSSCSTLCSSLKEVCLAAWSDYTVGRDWKRIDCGSYYSSSGWNLKCLCATLT